MVTKTSKSVAHKAPGRPKKAAAKKKQAAPKSSVVHKEPKAPIAAVEIQPEAVEEKVKALAKGRYIFATGRRKTAIANVRLFLGKGDHVINKKPLDKYFSGYSFYIEEISKPFSLTGLTGKYHVVGHINGGGSHSQAQALQHGIATALGKVSEEIRKVLKKNGLLTRDDRKKERKKPGLKRARRSPQWAKR